MFWLIVIIACPILGIACLATGEIFLGVMLLFASVVIGWAFVSNARDEKRAKSTQKPEPQSISKPEPPKPVPQPTSEHVKPVGKFCRHCGAKVEADDIYCIECGNKVQ